jgi:hypothetical protein
MTTATVTQQNTMEGGTPEPPTPQKPPRQPERTVGGASRVDESPRVDSLQAQVTGPGLKATRAHSSLPVPTGSATQLPKPQGYGQHTSGRRAFSSVQPTNPESRRESIPHFPLAPAFASLHQNPRTPETQTGRQRSASGPLRPWATEQLRPTIETIDRDNNADEISETDEFEIGDPMDALTHCEENVWNDSPFTNPRLREKIRKVAHEQTTEILVLSKKKVELRSMDYKDTYLHVFKRLVAKRIAANKPNSCTSTPSGISDISEYVTRWGDNPHPAFKKEPEDGPIPSSTPEVPNTLAVDPVVEAAMAHMKTPQRRDESDEDYRRRRDAAARLHHVTFETTPRHPNNDQGEPTEDTDSTRPPPKGTSEASGPAIRVPLNARMPMANNRSDRIVYQRLRNEDLDKRGSSLYDDQGIIFDGHRPIDVNDIRYARISSQAPAPDYPGGGNGPGNQGNDNGRRSQDYSRRPPIPDRSHTPYGAPGGGDGGPPNGGGGFDIGGDDSDLPGNQRPLRRGYSMPPADRSRLHTPGVRATNEHHRTQMHNRLLRLCRERLSARIKPPEGTKIRRAEASSVGTYSGSPKFSDLENWLINLVIMLQAIQYGGDDRDMERTICVPEFLSGEAKKWYARHVVHVNRSQIYWSFEEVILGLYDRFTHPTTMQDARDAYTSTKYSPQLGIQGFYDTLIDHAQNMSVYPDPYNIMDTFLRGLPKDMRTKMLENGLTPEANTVEDFVSEGKALESAMKTMNHYDRPSLSAPRTTDMPKTQSRHEEKMKKVGVTFIKKSDWKEHSGGSKPRVFVNNRTNFKPEPHDHQHANEKHEPAVDKPPDRDNPSAPAVICFNCNKPGHYAKDCKKPKRDRAHVRAARTAIVEEPEEVGNEPEPSEHGSQRLTESQGGRSGEDELVEVDVYDNDWYERDSDTEQMFAVREEGPTNNQGDKARFRKVQLRAEKTARPRPEVPLEEKECLATLIKIGECEAWTLWDSGSTTTGITPAFAQVADIRVFPLSNPHMLQLGTIGSRASVNFGADIEMKAPGISCNTYVDIANFDRYDMIIGTPFMYRNKVVLDFENKQVIANGIATPATRVLLEDNDGRLRRYRTVDKKKD